MPRPHSGRREDERHGTAIESLPYRPWRSGSKPDDTTLPPAERQHLRNATLFLSQLPQENRRGRERASANKTSNDQVRVCRSLGRRATDQSDTRLDKVVRSRPPGRLQTPRSLNSTTP